LAVIIQDGLRRMYQEQENVFYYITVMNENYIQPAMPKGVEQGILKGMYSYQETKAKTRHVQLMGSGTIFREVIAASELLEKDFGISSDVWSVTSFNELRRDGLDVERWNMLHPDKKPRVSYVEQCLAKRKGPVVAATDYMRAYPDQIRQFVPGVFRVLGTDGFGRSDSRSQLRKFFEVNRYYIVIAALKSLADAGELEAAEVTKAIKKYRIDPEKPNPVTV
jgi:pyruvate dehydrogenase E1 component